jgi:hypothetical protein
VDGSEGAPPAEPGAAERDALSGTLSTSYRARRGDGDEDHDLAQVASLSAGDSGQDRLTFHALASAALDVDGSDSGEEYAFYSLSDTYDHRLSGHLHHAYFDVHGEAGFEVLRGGRQVLYETPETVYFDGLRAESEPRGERGWRFGGYGGVQNLPYGSSRDGHYVVGAFAEAEPRSSAKLRADWLHAEDDEGSAGENLLALKGTLRPEERLTLEASHSRFVRDARDARAAARWYDPEAGLALDVRYYELLEPLRDFPLPLDPFYATLYDQFPYREASLTLGKELGSDWYLQAGAEARRVTDDADEGPLNREFGRWFAAATAQDLLPKEIAMTLTGEVWDGDGQRYETWGAALERDFGEDWRADLGSYYALFKFDAYLDEEREHVRTTYAGLQHNPTKDLVVRLRYELEDADLDRYHTLRLGVTWQF